jgi:ABC-type polysaccharide/polyol phosphate export permease
MTPIVYPIEIVPEALANIILTFNPLVPLVAQAQQIVLGVDSSGFEALQFPIVTAVILILFG